MKEKDRGGVVSELAVVYGAHPIAELIKAKKRKIKSVYTLRPYPRAWKRVSGLLQNYKYDVNIRIVDKVTLDRMAGSVDHMGVVALATPFVFRKKPFCPKFTPQVLVLDSIQDVKNLGAILRSAYCSGFTGVILTRKGCAPVNAAALKSSAGFAEHLDIVIANSLPATLTELKKSGYHICMAVPNGGIDVRKVKLKKPLCLVIGNEEKGITKNIFDMGILVSLPQISSDVSYNASVAAGILMFQLSYVTTY